VSAVTEDGGVESRQPENSRERILAAAAEIAAESGYEGTTISKVTKRSGLPVSSVYWFFKDKDELLAEVVRHSFDGWIAVQPAWSQLPEGTSLSEGLAAVLRRSVRSLAAAPDFLRIGHMLTLQTRTTEPAARTLFLQIRDDVEQGITDWFRAGLPLDVIQRRPELPRDLAQVVIAASDGLFLAQQIHDFWDPDEFVTLIVDVVEAAIAGA
jgi:AcrR family transcriptional regulator